MTHVRLVFDADMNRAVLSGLRLRRPSLDVVWAREIGMDRTSDPQLLEWAATQRRITISHDTNTMTKFARARIQAGRRCPGLVIVPQQLAVRRAIDDLVTLVERAATSPLDDQLVFLPLDKAWRVSEETAEWAAAGA